MGSTSERGRARSTRAPRRPSEWAVGHWLHDCGGAYRGGNGHAAATVANFAAQLTGVAAVARDEIALTSSRPPRT